MATVWVDARSQEQQAEALREIASRLLGENDPGRIRVLLAELSIIMDDQLRTIPPN